MLPRLARASAGDPLAVHADEVFSPASKSGSLRARDQESAFRKAASEESGGLVGRRVCGCACARVGGCDISTGWADCVVLDMVVVIVVAVVISTDVTEELLVYRSCTVLYNAKLGWSSTRRAEGHLRVVVSAGNGGDR